MRIQALVPMLLVTMALIGIIMKTYQHPITENILSSMILSTVAFVLAFAVSVIFLLLIDSARLDPIFLVNLLVYSVFFLGTYRMALSLRHRAIQNNKTTDADKPFKPYINEFSIEELLGRTAVKQEIQSVISYLAGKTVFVSGGGGLIGFELCRQILSYNAKRVIIFDINENKLYEAETELALKYPKTQFVTCIGSIQDRARLREVFDLYKPQVVFHSAAHKHVSLMESNPHEALKNNVMGTLYMVEAAIKHRVDRFILLSTDMAVHPTNIMGASKRVAEMLIQRASSWGSTRFSAVRFGTVIESRGSIVQLFKKQIQAGGPVYVTDKNTDKYLMTLQEAAGLILESGALSKGGEIFALHMTEPVNIYELAKAMIRRAGLKPDKDIRIEITGVWTAEKSMNEYRLPDDTVSSTSNEMIYVLKADQRPPVMFEAVFDKLCQSIDNRDDDSAFNKISVLVPTFHKVSS